MQHFILGTAGHVDHGKTTLIEALTGTNTDRLAEEQARGMTIDLGFAALALTPEVQLGVVDVPGHERFLKNMLAGAGGIDLALIVVAADEGPMPQTREHLDILTVLGVTHGVVALTKIDLADPELATLAELETRDALAKTSLRDAVIVPVSATTGAGLDALRKALQEATQKITPRDANAPVRLPIDRVFLLPGIGTVVTGTLVSGTLTVGDTLAVEPQALTTKARTLQSHSTKCESATPGMRVAVNLPSVEVGQLQRGAVLCTAGSLAATTLLDVRLSVLGTAAAALKHRERVRVHLGTGEVLARVVLLTEREIASGESEIAAQLLLESPAVAARGERFVVRTYSPAHTIGGGTVVDPQPARKYRRGDEAARALFEARGAGTLEDAVYAQLCARHAEFTVSEIAQALGLSPEAALEALVDAGRAVVLGGDRYLSDLAATRLKDTAKRLLTQFHKQSPLKQAMPRESLRVPLAKAATVKEFSSVISYLLAEGVCVAEGSTGLRLPEHRVVLAPSWQAAADQMLAVYRAARFLPPSPADFQANFPKDVVVVAILGVLVDSGQLVHLGDQLYLSAEAMVELRTILRRLAQTPEGITVGSVRDATGSSRKIILPLLEYLDGVHLTQRVGDTRILVESR